jgi:hypothetical protein
MEKDDLTMKTYKPATPAKLGGGNFKNSGQKPGKKSLNRKEMDKNRDAGVHAKVKKISKALFKKRMMVSEHSQVNG